MNTPTNEPAEPAASVPTPPSPPTLPSFEQVSHDLPTQRYTQRIQHRLIQRTR
jgi:hypothetical protein